MPLFGRLVNWLDRRRLPPQAVLKYLEVGERDIFVGTKQISEARNTNMLFTYSLACAELVGVQLPQRMVFSLVLLSLAIVCLRISCATMIRQMIRPKIVFCYVNPIWPAGYFKPVNFNTGLPGFVC